MLTRWAIPSWNGDVRFEASEKHDGTCRLVTAQLTELERVTIERWGKLAAKRGWVEPSAIEAVLTLPAIEAMRVRAPLAEAAAEMAKLLKFKARGVITAFRFEGGKVEVTEALGADNLPRWARKLSTEAPKEEPPAAGESTALAQVDPPAAPAAPTPEPEKAVTVRRPSLSCPECLGRPERDRMACDVLWDFLDDDQRVEWRKRRAITAFGNLTGHAYRLHPRDSEGAATYGRVAFDLDDRVILHNFLRDVPPEEELLAVKLLLENRENWLRVWGEVDPSHRASPGTIFPNPFAGQAIMGI